MKPSNKCRICRAPNRQFKKKGNKCDTQKELMKIIHQ